MEPLSRRTFMGTSAAVIGLPALGLVREPALAGLSQAATDALGWEIVTGHGAKGDGEADDTAAIQAAIDLAAARPKGGVVFFPPGEYRVTKGLTIRSNGVSLVGSGRQASTIITGAAMDSLLRLGDVATPVYRWCIRDLGFLDPRLLASVALQFGYGREGVASDVWIHQGFSRAGIELLGHADQGCWTNRFDRISLMGTGGDGVVFGPQSNAVFFTGCHFTSSAGVHVRFLQAQGVKFLGCQFEQAGSGIEFTVGGPGTPARALGVSIAHCYFELKSHMASARALRIDDSNGPVDVRWMSFEDNFVWGQQSAEYLVEIDAPKSVVTGSISRNGLFGGVRAGIRLRTSPGLQMATDGADGVKGYGTGEDLPLVERAP